MVQQLCPEEPQGHLHNADRRIGDYKVRLFQIPKEKLIHHTNHTGWCACAQARVCARVCPICLSQVEYITANAP